MKNSTDTGEHRTARMPICTFVDTALGGPVRSR
jgi:hypothetical protein